MLGRAMSTFVMFLSAATLQAMPIETTLNLLEAFSTSVSILVNTFSLSRLSAPFLSGSMAAQTYWARARPRNLMVVVRDPCTIAVKLILII